MLVLAGKQIETPFASKSWLDDPAYRIANDKASRSANTWIRGITLHTTHGKYPQPIIPGMGMPGSALANILYWNRSPAYASAHLLLDQDGTVCQCADLVTETTWHATSVNPITVGVEICQAADGSLYQGQIDVAVSLCDWLTVQLGIQRQVPQAYANKPIQRLVDGARDFVGIFGHRDQTSDRGRGDPGDFVMDALVKAGYERFDLDRLEDRTAWRERQARLGIVADGLPGKATVAALKSNPDGLWVRR